MSFRRGGGGRKRDSAEPLIIDALRKCGCFVQQVSGNGVPDLVVRTATGRHFCLEVKSPGGTRTKAQIDSNWPVVTTPEEAITAVWG